MIYACKKRAVILLALALLAGGLWLPQATAASPLPAGSLDSGFRLLYDLEFDRAHQVFSSWTQQHPDDPLGPASEAAGLLFSELDRLGILESQFYADDHAFDARKKMTPDLAVRDRFDAEVQQAEARARIRLAQNPKDANALFAMTLSAGLQADYAALIDKRNMASLHFTKDATLWANQLLAVDPTCYDARVATGFSKYVIGSMAAPLRWILRLGGIAGDKDAGIADLQMTAAHGRYLAPFARILLAIAYVREKDSTHAREILSSLREDFPRNPIFAREIAHLDSGDSGH